jgi:hypothetical protein
MRIICLGRDEKSREDFLKLVEKDSKPHVPAANLDAASGNASPIACNTPRSTPRKPTASAT